MKAQMIVIKLVDQANFGVENNSLTVLTLNFSKLLDIAAVLVIFCLPLFKALRCSTVIHEVLPFFFAIS